MDREPETDRQGDDPYTHAHPDPLYVTAAAKAYLAIAPTTIGHRAALSVWEALTGLTGTEAREYAEAIRTDAVTATIIPF